ncbi:hypothetical protein M434DRAFT_398395 [Hypoxylon sp. CO27-5]|nr:hypothetical protein M434DRAFT_398395 [Hypoxylon sp. CO27-5]
MLFTDIINAVHSSLAAAEPETTRTDIRMGDGDCCTTLLGGSGAVRVAHNEEFSKMPRKR